MTQEDRLEWKQMFTEILADANFVTKEDLKNFATKEDLKNFATKEDLKNFAMKEDLKNFAMKEDLKNLATKDDIIRLEGRIDKLEERMDKLEERMDKLEKYVHEKFLLIENEMMPKVNAMYEALTTRVSHEECNKRMEVIEDQTNAIDPLLFTVKRHTTKLEEHEVRIIQLETLA